jgi:hypothetical protein
MAQIEGGATRRTLETIAPGTPRNRSVTGVWWRRLVAGVLGLLAFIVVPVAVVGQWVESIVFDSDEIAEMTVETVTSPEVSGALGDRLAKVSVDIIASIGSVPSGSGLEELLSRELTALIRSGALDDRLTTVIIEAHELALTVIEHDGETTRVDVADGDVAINLLPLVEPALDFAARSGFLGEVDVPRLDPSGRHADHIAALEDAFGIDLDDDTGLVVVYSSSTVAEAGSWVDLTRRILEATRRGVGLVTMLAVLSVVGAVAASTRRSAHVARLGLVIAVLVGVVAVLIGRIPPAMAGLIEDPIWSAALDAGCSSLVARLRTWLLVTVAVGVVVAVLVIIGTRWHRRPRIDSDHGSDRGSDRGLGETTSVSASGTD